MYLEVHNMLRRERYCRKHITTWPKKTKVGNIFRYVMSLPKKAQFWDAYRPMRFWFWCSKHGRWQFFLEDRFSSFDRDLKNTKIMVPMNPEGVHGQPPPGSPTTTHTDHKFKEDEDFLEQGFISARHTEWLTELRFYVPLDIKRVIFGDILYITVHNCRTQYSTHSN